MIEESREPNAIPFELSRETLDVLAKIRHCEKTRGEVQSELASERNGLEELQRGSILGGFELGGDRDPGEVEEVARQAAIRIVSLEHKLAALDRLTADLRSQAVAELNRDREAEIERLRDIGRSLGKDRSELLVRYIEALAAAKVLEIEVWGWKEVWNGHTPGIPPVGQKPLWDLFHSEVHRLCAEKGLTADFVTLEFSLKEKEMRVNTLSRAAGRSDVDRALAGLAD